MPLVEVSEVVPAPVGKVWEALNNVESYTRVMDHVHSLTVLESRPDHRLIAWEVDLKGCLMKWIEREAIYPERHRIEYQQTKGDLEQFEGYWQLEPLSDETCRLTLTVQFEIGIPMLADMLNPVAERAIRNNSVKMITALTSLTTTPAAPAENVLEAP
jgi:ribosome-associated toxin RatA of RatAB toxin-antitoxin module